MGIRRDMDNWANHIEVEPPRWHSRLARRFIGPYYDTLLDNLVWTLCPAMVFITINSLANYFPLLGTAHGVAIYFLVRYIRTKPLNSTRNRIIDETLQREGLIP